jgi:hypothetical protein
MENQKTLNLGLTYNTKNNNHHSHLFHPTYIIFKAYPLELSLSTENAYMNCDILPL